MGDSATDGAYLFLGFNAAGECPAMELIVCADPASAIARARHWLASHLTCIRVQVWKDDVLLEEIPPGRG